jgi:hypothetical protein
MPVIDPSKIWKGHLPDSAQYFLDRTHKYVGQPEDIKYDTIKIVYTYIDTSKVKMGNYDGYRSAVQMWAYGYEVRKIRHREGWGDQSSPTIDGAAIDVYRHRDEYVHYKYLFHSKKEITNNIIITWHIQLK